MNAKTSYQPHIDIEKGAATGARGERNTFTARDFAAETGFAWEVKDLSGEDHSQRFVDQHGQPVNNPTTAVVYFDTADLRPGDYKVQARLTDKSQSAENRFRVDERGAQWNLLTRAVQAVEGLNTKVGEGLSVRSRRRLATKHQPLWVSIRQCTERRQFEQYQRVINQVLCEPNRGDRDRKRDCESFPGYTHGVRGYELVKAATEVFLLCHACCKELNIDLDAYREVEEELRLGGRVSGDDMQQRLRDYVSGNASPGTLPYIDRVLRNLQLTDLTDKGFPFCVNSLRSRPCLFELIWSYWHEEGMLVQAINTIALRFQNRRLDRNGRDPLASFELNPLRPISNLLWGYIQDEDQRLTVRRRAYEYEHEYGLTLVGRAVGELQPADRRSKFIEGFHSLLHEAARFYRDDANQWITPEPFPLYGAIKNVHLLLAEGAHNQFGDLPATARMEMLIQQWILSLPPLREFLQTRAMVPYDEPWMGPVDALKQLMGWTDTGVTHFHNLAVNGEKLLLSLRFGDWNAPDVIGDEAANWAQYWKPEIQTYIADYRAVTGVDLGVERQDVAPAAERFLPPSAHLIRRQSAPTQTAAVNGRPAAASRMIGQP